MNRSRVVVGTGLLALGVAALLDELDLVDGSELVRRWWPVLFLLAATLRLVDRPRDRGAALVLGAVGIALLAVTTGVADASVWGLLWAAVLVAIGVWLLTGQLRSRPVLAEGAIDVTAILGGREVIAPATFTGGTVTAVLGGVDLDLTRSKIDGTARLDVLTVMGGVEVHVPHGWDVRLEGPAVLGGNDLHVPPPADPDAPRLLVRGTAVLGGVDVKLGAVQAHWPADR